MFNQYFIVNDKICNFLLEMNFNFLNIQNLLAVILLNYKLLKKRLKKLSWNAIKKYLL